ncbi:hypothetical protein [Sphingosinicella sp. BN140058]|uniref:hypothetical protein n=1 Tax=Sphingosinicella sp. BN140058 TaxID=1892855 RepID=UPI0010136DC2|nr:hypothetical protein [Sphingosinicella sp. BN140058]QAY80342.1 hypothetical protein ETR14_27245 [Sphingosinicella sp. BN140058]
MTTDVAAKPTDYRWPIHSIDFEASGLGAATYPIEVGLSTWSGPLKPVRTWSSLICPTERWHLRGSWHLESELIHGISAGDLRAGITPGAAMRFLIRTIGGGGVALCDGGIHDRYWLSELVDAASIPLPFFLADWDPLYAPFSIDQYRAAHSFQAANPAPHRAGRDAEINLLAFAAGLGLAPNIAEQLP